MELSTAKARSLWRTADIVNLRRCKPPASRSRGERTETIRNLKAAYALRSRFVHHGHAVD
jgi:hypothetical protein